MRVEHSSIHVGVNFVAVATKGRTETPEAGLALHYEEPNYLGYVACAMGRGRAVSMPRA
jgi:hypothetical protein